MIRTITGDFKSEDQITNAMDDLLASGIDRDKMYVDYGQLQLKICYPDEIEPEVAEILRRHKPLSLH